MRMYLTERPRSDTHTKKGECGESNEGTTDPSGLIQQGALRRLCGFCIFLLWDEVGLKGSILGAWELESIFRRQRSLALTRASLFCPQFCLCFSSLLMETGGSGAENPREMAQGGVGVPFGHY